MQLGIQELLGQLTVADIVAAQRRLYIDLGFDPSGPCLWDATGGKVAPGMEVGDMQQAVTHSEDLWERMSGGKTAILVGSEADFGMGRMYQQLASNMPREIRVFTARDEALHWLLDLE